jgi:hypothetical protein
MPEEAEDFTVNYLPITFRFRVCCVFAQFAGMSEGDIIRLNRMYKCRATAPAATATTTSTPPKASTAEAGGESSSDKPTQPKTSLFEMLIFKIVGKN